jgi:ABC-2 type transport system permease protein
MASDSHVVSNLPAVTLNWASPIIVDEEKNSEREVVELLRSSPASWTRIDTSVQPNFDLYPEWGFAVGDPQQSHVLAVSVQGVFESHFKDKPSPLAEDDAGEEGEETSPESVPGTIEVSPETARLVVFGSAEFVDDVVFEISSSLAVDRYLNSLKLVQNAVAWATEDVDLLGIRARGTSARVLMPLAESAQSVWEIANYAVALLALVAVGVYWRVRRTREVPMALVPCEEIDDLAGEVG